MQSPRALGIFALCAVILSAISFAAVDVTISNANGCVRALACADEVLPPLAVLYAVVGVIALLASVLPAITWLIDAIHHTRHDADIEPMRVPMSRFGALQAELVDDDL
ncbi:MAG: hypothetical protein ABI566_13150 [Pseudolysinimonas sp.]